MLKEDADRDLRELRRRITRQTNWIEQLRSVGQDTTLAERELSELTAALDHIPHHRAVLEFSLGRTFRPAYEAGASHG